MEKYQRLFEIVIEAKAKDLFTEIPIPQIIVIGVQSAGKSSLLGRIIGEDILPIGNNTCTKCPIEISIGNTINNDKNYGYFLDDSSNTMNIPQLKEQLRTRNSKNQNITNHPIKLCIFGPNKPRMTLVDLPGIALNKSEHLDILEMIKKYSEMPNSIILTVSSASEDIDTSQAINEANKYDKTGKRKIHVLTKIDNAKNKDLAKEMNEDYLKDSLGVFLTSNKSDDKHETEFLQQTKGIDPTEHGIERLRKQLDKIFKDALQKYISMNKSKMRNRINELENRQKELASKDVRTIVFNDIDKFEVEFKEILDGTKSYPKIDFQGGAKISIKLHDYFKNAIKCRKVSEFTDKEYYISWRNMHGQHFMSENIILLAEHILIEEIETCKDVIIKTQQDVFEKMNELVTEALNNIKINEDVRKRIQEEMDRYTTKRNRKTNSFILKKIESEKCAISICTSELEKLEDENLNIDIENFGSYIIDTYVNLRVPQTIAKCYKLLKTIEHDNIFSSVPSLYSYFKKPKAEIEENLESNLTFDDSQNSEVKVTNSDNATSTMSRKKTDNDGKDNSKSNIKEKSMTQPNIEEMFKKNKKFNKNEPSETINSASLDIRSTNSEKNIKKNDLNEDTSLEFKNSKIFEDNKKYFDEMCSTYDEERVIREFEIIENLIKEQVKNIQVAKKVINTYFEDIKSNFIREIPKYVKHLMVNAVQRDSKKLKNIIGNDEVMFSFGEELKLSKEKVEKELKELQDLFGKLYYKN